ncbi:NYN domain-containing protein [Nonomuraea indica]|uniref:NYN domain-containing protein n=1 Tax=Nonomuraea indica TaxID=1581193 RepID=A0ABW7ZWB9_9ACTN
MDRCALFVDAGYLLADGAMAVHGTRHREAVSWDYPGLLQLMTGLSRERTGLPLLRCYWYEATVEGRRTPEHDVLADLPGLKLRLSRIRPGRREGVDAQVYRDLMTLARNNAICDAVVVSGDEDLAQVVCDAQDLGIRVTVVHVAAEGGWAVSRTLRQEGDDLIELGAAHLRPYVTLVTGISESNGHHQPLSNGHPASHAASHTATHALPAPPPAPPPPSTSSAPGSLPASLPTPPQSTGSHAAPPRSSGHASSGHSSHSSPAHSASSAHNPQAHNPQAHNPPAHNPPALGAPGHSSPAHGSAAPAAPAGDSGSSPGHGQGSTPSALPSYFQQDPPPPAPATGPIQQQPQSPSTGQFTMPSANGTYQPAQLGAYTGPQPSPVPPAATGGATTLADAVKAAHREGHDFGESVARDAPALWLEAVLARKPRMPSDLEARLLQGSSLPIDFLLHDEVRHALRRGFWDALERARQ